MDKLVENFLLQENLFWREGMFWGKFFENGEKLSLCIFKKGVDNRKTGYTMWNKQEENLH
jgi:hypothetical protein